MIFLYLVTPLLGTIRNYVKYKQLKPIVFLRTPITYFIFHMFYVISGYRDAVLRTLISERWFFFIYKTFISIKNNDYRKNKEKYIKKYGLQYTH